MRQYADQAREKLSTFAERLDQDGPQALMTDLAAFARRRPGIFLLGAAGAGFVVGRIVRGTAAANGDGASGTQNMYAPGYTTTYASRPGYTTGSTVTVGDGEVWT